MKVGGQYVVDGVDADGVFPIYLPLGICAEQALDEAVSVEMALKGRCLVLTETLRFEVEEEEGEDSFFHNM